VCVGPKLKFEQPPGVDIPGVEMKYIKKDPPGYSGFPPGGNEFCKRTDPLPGGKTPIHTVYFHTLGTPVELGVLPRRCGGQDGNVIAVWCVFLPQLLPAAPPPEAPSRYPLCSKGDQPRCCPPLPIPPPRDLRWRSMRGEANAPRGTRRRTLVDRGRTAEMSVTRLGVHVEVDNGSVQWPFAIDSRCGFSLEPPPTFPSASAKLPTPPHQRTRPMDRPWSAPLVPRILHRASPGT